MITLILYVLLGLYVLIGIILGVCVTALIIGGLVRAKEVIPDIKTIEYLRPPVAFVIWVIAWPVLMAMVYWRLKQPIKIEVEIC